MKKTFCLALLVGAAPAAAYTPTVSGSFGDSFSTVVRSNVPTCKVIDGHTVVNCACCRAYPPLSSAATVPAPPHPPPTPARAARRSLFFLALPR